MRMITQKAASPFRKMKNSNSKRQIVSFVVNWCGVSSVKPKYQNLGKDSYKLLIYLDYRVSFGILF